MGDLLQLNVDRTGPDQTRPASLGSAFFLRCDWLYSEKAEDVEKLFAEEHQL